jgi:D-sedoheptulose 7-phosphate isomerase
LREAIVADGLAGRLDEMLELRLRVGGELFEREAERVARLCHAMAERFASGGRLLALGSTPASRSDARHVAVEFVHPVIVGKRALPAIALVGERGELVRQAGLIAREGDIAIAFGTEDDEESRRAIARVRERGALTIAFGPAEAEWRLEPATEDHFVRQEVVETLYHVLWELVHVFFEHRGLLSGRSQRRRHDAGASSFLYPFLSEDERALEPVVADVGRSALMKSEEVSALREQTLIENRDVLLGAACALRERFADGRKLLAIGNGGSATDAMDVVADLRTGAAGGRARPAIDLTEDCAILTAIANDIGTEAIFSRQVIAYGEPGDILLALSTSGNSANVIAALAEARRRELCTIALVGYDGGRVAAEALADFVVVTRSEHIPRIQEAQASAYHALCELLAWAPGGPD